MNNMIHKDYCSRCKATGVPLIKQSKTATTQYYWCRDCHNAKMRAYSRTTRGREVIQRIQDRAKSKHPKKVQARMLVAYAISIGYLKKPKHCSECNSEKRLHGHHPNYDDALGVIWVCASCHKVLHKLEK